MIVPPRPPRPPGPFWHDGSDILGTPEEVAALRKSSDEAAARIRAYAADRAKRSALAPPPASPPPVVALTPPPAADPSDAAPVSAETVRWALDTAPRLPYPVGPEMGLTVVWMDACRRHHEAMARGDAHAAAVAAFERAAAWNRLEEFGSDLSTALLILLRYARRFDKEAARELLADLIELPSIADRLAALERDAADQRRDLDGLAVVAEQLQESSAYLPAAPAEVCP